MATIRQEFQAAIGVSVYTGTLRIEVHQFSMGGSPGDVSEVPVMSIK